MKRRWITLGWALVFLFFMVMQTTAAWAEGSKTQYRSIDPTLLNSLRQGGYILYVRHGEATIGEDRPDLRFNDCSTQRNLSEAGRRQAVDFGATLRKLQIPVQVPVLASPFCRTRETASLAFGAGNVQTDPFWVRVYRLGGELLPSERQATLQALTSVLEKIPPSGTNQVIVAHSFPLGVGLGEIPYLGTVIVKPKGQGSGYEIAGRAALDEWPSGR